MQLFYVFSKIKFVSEWFYEKYDSKLIPFMTLRANITT